MFSCMFCDFGIHDHTSCYFIYARLQSVFYRPYDLSAVWGGAKLADILELIGVPKLTSCTQSGGKHIEFVSIDKCEVVTLASWNSLSTFFCNSMAVSVDTRTSLCIFLFKKMQEENGGPYKASIPLSQATNPEADVLLAYEMNGEVSNFYLMIIFFPTLGKTRNQTELNKYAKMVASFIKI